MNIAFSMNALLPAQILMDLFRVWVKATVNVPIAKGEFMRTKHTMKEMEKYFVRIAQRNSSPKNCLSFLIAKV